MNCQKVESLISDVARAVAGGQIMDAAVRRDVTEHTAECATCAARFTDEKILAGGLRSLAAADAGKAAPASVEANLLAAFRQQAAAGRRQSEVPARRITAWWAAAAAVILVAVAVAALRIESARVDHSSSQEAPQETKQKAAETPAPNPAPERLPQLEPRRVTGNSGGLTPVVKEASARNQRRTGMRSGMKDARVAGSRREGNGASAKAEIVTEFISLTKGYTLGMAEGGQLVRVELPRSALSSFGLPVNQARLDEPIKADVVLGYDGIARAIRFVR